MKYIDATSLIIYFCPNEKSYAITSDDYNQAQRWMFECKRI